MIFQEPMTALNPVMTCGDQIDEVLRAAHPAVSPTSGAPKVLGIVARGAAARARAHRRVLPAPALRRPAPAHHDRDGAGARAGAADRRRADHRARRHHAGADPAADPRAAEARTAPACCSSRTTSASWPRSRTASRCCAWASWSSWAARRDVLQRPQHAYTQMLIGAVPTLRVEARPATRTAPLVLQRARPGQDLRRPALVRQRAHVHAAEDVDLEIRRGQTLGIVGESGSGKSTVARCIVRLIDPSGGSVQLGGDDIATMSRAPLRPLRRRVQIVFQDPYRSLNPRRTVGEAMIEGPMNYGVPRAEALRRAHDLLELVRMDASGADALSAPVLRRPAPAHLHRARADDGARAADRRRGGVGARRLGAGAGAASCSRRSARG